MNQVKVKSLWIYPIKSCRGIPLMDMQITKTGPAYDRQFMFVDQDNKFITLRTEPKLSQIQPVIDGQSMTLHFNERSLNIQLDRNSDRIEAVTVWKDTFKAGIESDAVNKVFSEYFGYSTKLVRYQQQSFRDLQTGTTEFVKETMFSDSRPILLTNENSLIDLNAKISLANSTNPSAIERFRSNIIISGLEAFKEDHFKSWKINGLTLNNPKLCGRCPIITQEITTGQVVSNETLTTLAGFRRDGTKVLFGVYLTPGILGKISVGDQVTAF